MADRKTTDNDDAQRPQQVCDMLGVSMATLARYRKQGKIKSIQLNSRTHRFRKSEIERFLEAAG